MVLQRTLSGTLKRASRTFPALLVTGPRQAGKTTLLREHFGHTHRYCSLENLDVRERAAADPVGFLRDNPPPVILDEIQHVPELLTYIQTAIDEDRRPGRWILSGSQSFPLLEGASESLAGRVAILTLLPLSTAEARRAPRPDLAISDLLDEAFAAPPDRQPGKPTLGRWLLRGSFPEPWTNLEVDRQLWAASYIQTYLERDVRNVIRVKDLGTFQTFLRLAAARTAQMLNLADLARDVGVSPPTVRQWLNLLEASHQIYLLRPFFESFGKRMVKSPKLYWLDTGLVTFLMGLHDEETVRRGPFVGALIETAVVADFVKAFQHRGIPPQLWHWRTAGGWEVDLVVEHRGRLHPVEIKATSTPRPAHASNLTRFRELTGERSGAGLLMADVPEASSLVPGVRVLPWNGL